jgi:hypothetical protein
MEEPRGYRTTCKSSVLRIGADRLAREPQDFGRRAPSCLRQVFQQPADNEYAAQLPNACLRVTRSQGGDATDAPDGRPPVSSRMAGPLRQLFIDWTFAS